jgi:hypothetical protein
MRNWWEGVLTNDWVRLFALPVPDLPWLLLSRASSPVASHFCLFSPDSIMLVA